ncbi:hypothetical protein Gotur_033367 [Gossypium turneri]
MGDQAYSQIEKSSCRQTNQNGIREKFSFTNICKNSRKGCNVC